MSVRELCESCGQPKPESTSYLTPRELDVLAAWFVVGTVRAAADRAGVGQQRAKNILAAARIRNRAGSNDQLVRMHFDQVLSAVRDATSHNSRGRAA